MKKKVEKVMALNLPVRRGTWRSSFESEAFFLDVQSNKGEAIALTLTDWAREATAIRYPQMPNSHVKFCGNNPIRIQVEEVIEEGHTEPSGIWIKLVVGGRLLSQAYLNGVKLHPFCKGVTKMLVR